MAFSSMDDPESGKAWGRLNTKEVEKKVEESVNWARPSPYLDAKLLTRLRWYWASILT